MAVAYGYPPIKQWAMLTDPYVEAVLVDPVAADAIWELWDANMIPDEVAEWAWLCVAVSGAIQWLPDA